MSLKGKPPQGAAAPEDNFQAPLGPRPAYDDVVDQAIEYTFPCSDPIAIQSCCTAAVPRESAAQAKPKEDLT